MSRDKTETAAPVTADSADAPAVTDDGRPFGVDPRHSRTPLVVWGVLYAAWVLALLLMAVQQAG